MHNIILNQTKKEDVLPIKILQPTIHKFTFYIDDQWCIKINEKGIFFNRERFPESTPGDFADAFIEILEKNYAVSFTKKD